MFSGKIIISKGRMNSWVVISFGFFFPIIAVLNYLLNIQSGILSQTYRGINLIISLLIIGYVTWKSIDNKKTILHIGLAFFILFWIIYILRLLIDIELFKITENTFYSKSYYYSFTIGVTFLPALAAALLKPIDIFYLINDLKKVLVIFNIAIVLLFFRKIITDGNFSRFSLERVDVDFLNPITIGTYATILILICLFSKEKKTMDYFYLLVGTINLFAAASKGPMLFAIVVILIASLSNLKLFFKNYMDVILKVFLAFIALPILLFFSSKMLIVNRIINFSSDKSSSIRSEILSNAMSQFFSEPILGSHFLVFKTKFYSHNLLLDVLLANGLVGMLLLLPVFIIFIGILFKNKFRSVFLLIVLFLFFCSNTSGSVYSSNEFWITLAIILTNQYQFIDQKRTIYLENS